MGAHIGQIASQLDALVERLAELPKGVSATPIYERMKKLERERDRLQEKMQGLEVGSATDEPILIKNWLELGKSVIPLLDFQEGDNLKKEKLVTSILAKLVHRVEIGRETIRIHYFVDGDHIKKAALSSAALLWSSCSTRLTNGGCIVLCAIPDI